MTDDFWRGFILAMGFMLSIYAIGTALLLLSGVV